MALLSLIPLALMFCVYTALLKLAALAFRRTQLRWVHAFFFSVLIALVTLGAVAFRHLAGLALPLALSVPLALVVHLGLGGWYFGPRASTRAGVLLAFKGGAILSFIGFTLIVVIGIFAAIALPALNVALKA